jgi:hypothetical protein
MSNTATQGSDLVLTDLDRPTAAIKDPPIIAKDILLETVPRLKSPQDILSQLAAFGC